MNERATESRIQNPESRTGGGRGAAGVFILGLVLAGMWVPAGEATGVRLGTIDKSVRLVVQLPPLAEVGAVGPSGKTWQQSGLIQGSLETARGDFECSLRGAGWKRDKVIGLGRSELTRWERGRQSILLMVWEKEVGLCGFTWGEEK